MSGVNGPTIYHPLVMFQRAHGEQGYTHLFFWQHPRYFPKSNHWAVDFLHILGIRMLRKSSLFIMGSLRSFNLPGFQAEPSWNFQSTGEHPRRGCGPHSDAPKPSRELCLWHPALRFARRGVRETGTGGSCSRASELNERFGCISKMRSTCKIVILKGEDSD